ncbi:hypothetical protein ACYSNW_14885 [Enterococcus sp. LJL99]
MKLRIKDMLSKRVFSKTIITLMFFYIIFSTSNIPFLFKLSFFLLFFFYSLETDEVTGQSEKNTWKFTKETIDWKWFFTIIGIFIGLILLTFFILWRM